MRAGLRRYCGTELGDNYGSVLAWAGEGDYSDPDPHERALGDFVDPTRSARMVDCVNAVSREVGADVADWRVDRLLSMVGVLVHERRQGPPEPPAPG